VKYIILNTFYNNNINLIDEINLININNEYLKTNLKTDNLLDKIKEKFKKKFNINNNDY
jgi:hypothetical protein